MSDAGKMSPEQTLELFVRANEGASLDAELPRLVELANEPGLANHAASVLTLLALERPVPPVKKIEWYLKEGSVLLPDVTLGWEMPDPPPQPDRRSWLRRLFGDEPPPPPQKGFGPYPTFRVAIGNGSLSWHERNLVIERSIEDFNANGPPPEHGPPDDVLKRLRAIVGGRAGENRARARARLLAKMTPLAPDCTQCPKGYQLAAPRAGESLDGTASLLAVAYKSFPTRQLLRCLACGAHFEFENDYEFQYTDIDSLVPIGLDEAIAFVNDAFIVA